MGKRAIIAGIVSGVLITGGIIAGYFFLEHKHEEEMADMKNELTAYQTTFPDYYTVTAYTIASDKSYGQAIKEEELIPVQAAQTQDGNLITDPADIAGKYFRINLTAGTLLTHDVITEIPINSDDRSFDVITSYNPIGLAPNDYVDIRFITPNGEDYVAISHKWVEGIYNGVLKLAMNEYDIMIYNSLVVDKILLEGSMIYSTKYLEPGGQDAAAESYPVSDDVLYNVLSNPNIDKDIDYISIAKRRNSMLKRYRKYCADESSSGLVEAGKDIIPDKIEAGQSDYEMQQERAKQEALEAAILAQQNGE